MVCYMSTFVYCFRRSRASMFVAKIPIPNRSRRQNLEITQRPRRDHTVIDFAPGRAR